MPEHLEHIRRVVVQLYHYHKKYKLVNKFSYDVIYN
jgi:hypothetical protein